MTTYSIVFICSGNRFRSPLATAFIRQLTRGLPVEVESFGTLDLDAMPALAEAWEIARRYGIDLSEHRTRCLVAQSAAGADLVLGFEEEHVHRAVVDAGAARERSFTLPEIVSLLEGLQLPENDDSLARARQAVEGAAARRHLSLTSWRSESIRDPLGRGWREYAETAARIRDLSVALVWHLFGVVDRGEPPLPSAIAKSRAPGSQL
jgi:protein-tyrosine-phosphatase